MEKGIIKGEIERDNFNFVFAAAYRGGKEMKNKIIKGELERGNFSFVLPRLIAEAKK